MSAIIWLVGGAALAAALVPLVLWRMRAAKKAERARHRAAAWDSFVSMAPGPPSRPRGEVEEVYPLSPPPGPAGEIAIWSDGLVLRLASAFGREVWIPWDDVMRIEPETGGIQIRLANGLRVHVNSLSERSLYHHKSLNVRRPASRPSMALPPTPSGPALPGRRGDGMSRSAELSPSVKPALSTPAPVATESDRWSAIWSESTDFETDLWPQASVDTPRFGDPVDEEPEE